MDDNYDFSYVAGTLTITKVVLTVTAENKTRAYGAANPAFTVLYSGFVNSENSGVIDTPPTASSLAIATTPVGTIAITVGGGADNNYDFNYVAGVLTISKATLTATADNQSRAYGAANPVFTISYTGFANGETSAVINTPPTANTAATATSNVGTYTITPSGGLDDNYAFSFANGTLTITKAMLTVTADNKTRAYGAANPAFTILYSGFANSETGAVLNTAPTASSTAIATTPAGRRTCRR